MPRQTGRDRQSFGCALWTSSIDMRMRTIREHGTCLSGIRSAQVMTHEREATELLREINGYVERAQHALAEYLPPDSGITPRDAISNVLSELDNGGLLKVQAEARELLGEQPAFFGAE